MRRLRSDDSPHGCDCPAHQHAAAPTRADSGALWSVLLPVLACAICPACVAVYAKILSLVGISFGLSELQHSVLLLTAIAVSLAVSAWRSVGTRRAWPFTVALFGSAMVLAGHLAEALHALEWAGVLVLLAGGLAEHFRLRRSAPHAHAAQA